MEQKETKDEELTSWPRVTPYDLFRLGRNGSTPPAKGFSPSIELHSFCNNLRDLPKKCELNDVVQIRTRSLQIGRQTSKPQRHHNLQLTLVKYHYS
uniref:Uncharacterized protein n=1 Tax=Arion vulgaris TaxID=1028688 RepID=A0A0B7ACB3_9EUPU